MYGQGRCVPVFSAKKWLWVGVLDGFNAYEIYLHFEDNRCKIKQWKKQPNKDIFTIVLVLCLLLLLDFQFTVIGFFFTAILLMLQMLQKILDNYYYIECFVFVIV